MNNIGAGFSGVYRDKLLDASGHVVYDGGWVANTIVEQCHILLAALLKGGQFDINHPHPFGIGYLAVGRGFDRDWHPTELPAPADTKKLVDDSPKLLTNLVCAYLLKDHEHISATPTNVLQIAVILKPGSSFDPMPPLREFGLFGRVGGTDYMINYVRHPLITIEQNMTLQRTIQLEL